MIIDNKITDIRSEGEELQTTEMGIAVENETAIVEIVVGFYKDKVNSIIRESVSNGIDSRTESGIDKPVIAKLHKKNDGWYFSVQDFGVGVNQDTIDNILSKFGKSTKNSSNKFIGAFGLGFKAPFCYTSYFTCTGRKNGIEGKWIFRRSETKFTIDCLYNDIPTTEENGCIIEVKLHESQYNIEVDTWSTSMRKQLAYFRNVYIIDEYNPIPEDYKIYESEDFRYSDINQDKVLHICLDDVYYPIDYNHLDISPIYIPVALKFKLGEGINPLPARESYYNNEGVKELILSKIEKVSDFLVSKYNEGIQVFKTWKEGRLLINNTNHNLNLNGINLNLNHIKKYSPIPIKSIEIEGFEQSHLTNLYRYETGILKQYRSIAQINNDRFKSKYYTTIEFGRHYLICEELPVGNFREYLKSLYNHICLIKKGERRLGKRSRSYDVAKNWTDALYLSSIPKEQWRTYIIEAQKIIKEFENNCINIKDINIDPVWLQERIRSKRKKYESKILDKNKGDVTIAFSSSKIGGFKYEKEVYKLEEIQKLYRKCIYTTQQNREKIEQLQFIIKSLGFKNYTTAIIGPRESKKIEHLNNFIKMEGLKGLKDLKLLGRFATAYKVKQVNYTLQSIIKFSNLDDLLNFVAKEYEPYIYKLKKYVEQSEYIKFDSNFAEELLLFCRENNIYDAEMMETINNIEKFINNFYFLKFIEVPERSYAEGEEEFQNRIKEFKNFIHSFLVHRKLNRNELDEWRLCPPSKSETEELQLEIAQS